MISSLEGIVQHLDEDSLVLEVGGVGFQLDVPRSVVESIPGIGKRFFVYTKLMIKEENVILFGFSSVEQRDLFNTLLRISGVGPRLAMAILSTLSPEVLQSAVANDQAEVLIQVPGIGKKTAERILFNLKDKLQVPVAGAKLISEVDDEVLSVLTTLGYSLIEAQNALQSIPKDSPEDIESRVRLALQHFMK